MATAKRECPKGTYCNFRTDPNHSTNFSHTKPPQPKPCNLGPACLLSGDTQHCLMYTHLDESIPASEERSSSPPDPDTTDAMSIDQVGGVPKGPDLVQVPLATEKKFSDTFLENMAKEAMAKEAMAKDALVNATTPLHAQGGPEGPSPSPALATPTPLATPSPTPLPFTQPYPQSGPQANLVHKTQGGISTAQQAQAQNPSPRAQAQNPPKQPSPSQKPLDQSARFKQSNPHPSTSNAFTGSQGDSQPQAQYSPSPQQPQAQYPPSQHPQPALFSHSNQPLHEPSDKPTQQSPSPTHSSPPYQFIETDAQNQYQYQNAALFKNSQQDPQPPTQYIVTYHQGTTNQTQHNKSPRIENNFPSPISDPSAKRVCPMGHTCKLAQMDEKHANEMFHPEPRKVCPYGPSCQLLQVAPDHDEQFDHSTPVLKICPYDDCKLLNDPDHTRFFKHLRPCPYGSQCQFQEDFDHKDNYSHNKNVPAPIPQSNIVPMNQYQSPPVTNYNTASSTVTPNTSTSRGYDNSRNTIPNTRGVPKEPQLCNLGDMCPQMNDPAHSVIYKHRSCPAGDECLLVRTDNIHASNFFHPKKALTPTPTPTPTPYATTGRYGGGYSNQQNTTFQTFPSTVVGPTYHTGGNYTNNINPPPTNKPDCPKGRSCTQTNDYNHKQAFMHPCRNGWGCKQKNDPVHASRFVH